MAITIGIIDNDNCAADMITLILPRLNPDFHVLWTSTDSHTALEHCLFDTTVPDVLLLDMALNGISGVEVCRKIREHNTRIGIVGITEYPLERYREDCGNAGAQGLIEKRAINTQETTQVIRNAAHGRATDHTLFHDCTDLSPARHTPSILSSQELKVLSLYSQYYATRDIAAMLHIAEGTVYSHTAHAVHKLGAANTREAIRVCQAKHLF